MDPSDRKVDKTPVVSPRTEVAAKSTIPGTFPPSDAVSGYAGAEDGSQVPQLSMTSPMTPYYTQYPAVCALPPGAVPMGFHIPPPPGTGSPQMWVPGMIPPAPTSNPNTALTPHPYVSPYGAGAQPVMYMPMPYSYSPYMAATAATSATAVGTSFSAPQPAKPAGQVATPPYTSSASAPLHTHSSTAESPILSTPFAETPTNSAAPAPFVAPVPTPVSSITAVELCVMPLMPNTKLPPGDPFCPAGVTVPSQYATASGACLADDAAVNASLSLPPHQCISAASGFLAAPQEREVQAITAAAAAACISAS
ncbi:hypothetical protein LSCM1_04557 [Leishmania martiniquensis]|uniref:Uncharacterized protein n=1 Tax=Leishmania martiniquensis TaxID=1580590 RepID=A0A836HA72_9TRYP|nr:hypothetical protein LSCM1_04557 [Leishmania martiniquensis]